MPVGVVSALETAVVSDRCAVERPERAVQSTAVQALHQLDPWKQTGEERESSIERLMTRDASQAINASWAGLTGYT